MLKHLPYAVLFLVLLLAGCARIATPPTPSNGDTDPLFDDNSLRNAKPVGISGENELTGLDLNNEIQATELPYNDTEADSQLSAQAVLPGAKGFVALYRKSGATFEIRLYDQTNNAATLVYSGLQEVQSVAVNATASRVVASMKNPSNNKFDVYLFKLDNGATPLQLTNSATLDETNVSMTRDASKIAWEGPVSTTNARIRPYICAYDAVNATCTLTFLSNASNQIQPSLSANGLYMVMVRVLSNPTRSQVLRYRFSDSTYTSVQTVAAPDFFADPSVDDTGSKVMYFWRRNSTTTNFIRIKDLLSNTVATELSSTNTLEHPFITADGQFVTYQQLGTRFQVRTRNIASNAVAVQDSGTFDDFQPFWMVPCGTGTTVTGDRTLVTQADVNALAGVSKITGNLFLNPSTTSLDLSPLASLTEVTGRFELADNNTIQTQISGFECLATLGGDFDLSVSGTTGLTSLSGFPALTSVGGEFVIFNADSLVTVSGFGALTSVGGQFNILSNTALTSVSSFAALTSVGGDFNIIFNNALQSITGFNLLESGRIAGTATVRNNTQLNCQTPDPRFSPVDVSSDNAVNCFTDIAVVGFAWVEQPATASYTPNTGFSYNATGGSITANRTATGTYNIVFAGLTLDANSNVQVTAYEDFAGNNYCNIQAVSGSIVNVRCFNGASNALADTIYTIAITDKTTGSAAKVAAYVLANNKTSASYTPATDTSYNGYGGTITATRTNTGNYQVSFANADFFNGSIQVTALDEKAYCGIDTWNATQVAVFCFDQAGNAIDSRYSLAVIDNTPPAGTTSKIVGYAFADKGGTTSYTPNPLFAYNQTGFGVSAVRDKTGTGVYSTIFNSQNLTSNYHVQVTARGNAANYCVLGPAGPIGVGDNVLTTCYNSAGTAANTLFSIWVVQK